MREMQLRKALGEVAIVRESDDRLEKVVKSAARVFHILELLDVLGREALVCEISEVLGLPQSSTSVLLRSMVDLGYLVYNPATRAYRPTTRVALLGHSVGGAFASDGLLMRLVERLNARSGQMVAVSCRNRTHFRYIHVLQARMPGRSFVVNGLNMPLTSSASGLVLLAELPDAEIKRIALRINVEGATRYHVDSLAAMMAEVVEVRRRGFAFSMSAESKAGMIAMRLPNTNGTEMMAIGIGAGTKFLQPREREIVAMLREEIERYLNLASQATPQDTLLASDLESSLVH